MHVYSLSPSHQVLHPNSSSRDSVCPVARNKIPGLLPDATAIATQSLEGKGFIAVRTYTIVIWSEVCNRTVKCALRPSGLRPHIS